MNKKVFVLLLSSLPFMTLAQKDAKVDSTKSEAVVQKKFSCDSIVVNFDTGMLNNRLSASSPMDSIRKYLPCVSTEFPLGTEERNCGGGAQLDKQGIFFNLEHGSIDFASNTTAYLPYQIFGVSEDSLTTVAGDPSEITDLQPYVEKPMQSVYIYPKPYGCLTIWVDQKDKRVFKVQLHNQPPGRVYLCVD